MIDMGLLKKLLGGPKKTVTSKRKVSSVSIEIPEMVSEKELELEDHQKMKALTVELETLDMDKVAKLNSLNAPTEIIEALFEATVLYETLLDMEVGQIGTWKSRNGQRIWEQSKGYTLLDQKSQMAYEMMETLKERAQLLLPKEETPDLISVYLELWDKHGYTATREEAELITVIFGFSWFLNYDDPSLQELELPRLSNEEVTEAVETAIRSIDVAVEGNSGISLPSTLEERTTLQKVYIIAFDKLSKLQTLQGIHDDIPDEIHKIHSAKISAIERQMREIKNVLAIDGLSKVWSN